VRRSRFSPSQVLDTLNPSTPQQRQPAERRAGVRAGQLDQRRGDRSERQQHRGPDPPLLEEHGQAQEAVPL